MQRVTNSLVTAEFCGLQRNKKRWGGGPKRERTTGAKGLLADLSERTQAGRGGDSLANTLTRADRGKCWGRRKTLWTVRKKDGAEDRKV